MINDLPLFFDIGGKNPHATRPIRMGFFHFSNNNLSIRKECARDLGMYDPAATKAEDVDLCFRIALSPKWVAWRENAAVVRHKGRRTLWELLTQMWGYGFYVGYPYAKTGIHGVFLYWLSGGGHKLLGRFETDRFPLLVCAFATNFYFVNALMLMLIWSVCTGHSLIGLLAIAGLLWTVPRYLHDVLDLGLSPWETFKLAVVHYLSNLSFTTAALIGALRHGVILIPSSLFKLDSPGSPIDVGATTTERQSAVSVRGADSYTPASDLWVVTCYFNPQSYAPRLENYHRFKAAFDRSGARLITVECVFNDQPFVLSGANVIHVRAADVMWQKERLLNIAISSLPPECRKIAWLDSDILFQNPDWLVQTSKLLDRFPIVQPFEEALLLPKGLASYSGEPIASAASFASVYSSAPSKHLAGDFRKHGHTGFAWAARRDLLLSHGLYEACVAGDGDHMMAHAGCGDWDSPCVCGTLIGFVHRNHFRLWAAEFYKNVRGRIGYVPGTILHLCHGDSRYMRSYERLVEFAAVEFDPAIDIRVGRSGALEWNSPKPELHRWLQNYFAAGVQHADTEST